MNQKYEGKDSYGKPKIAYLDRLETLDDAQLMTECKDKIWLSAYANNNPRSDYHWQCDACYDECKCRNKLDIYKTAFKKASGT